MINKPKVIGGIGEKKSNRGTQWYMQDRIYCGDYTIAIATAFNPYYLVKENDMEEYKDRICEIRYDEGIRFFKDDICGTIRTIESGGNKSIINNPPLRIRKLTPKECFRLMGFDDDDFEKASAVNSNTQLYKQAGNSIVVNVLEEIFKQLL